MSSNTDLNSYFEYVDKVIEESNVIDSEKDYCRRLISFFKVTGRATVDIRYGYSDYTNIEFEEELYILYEILSFRFFKLLNYYAWRKRRKFGIL